jgi:hypothetical protein
MSVPVTGSVAKQKLADIGVKRRTRERIEAKVALAITQMLTMHTIVANNSVKIKSNYRESVMIFWNLL